jgi:hypothetical protein
MSTYFKQKLFDALHALVSDGELDERLTSAAAHLVQLNERDIPDDIQERFKALRSSLFSTSPGDNQHKPAQYAAHEILDLFTSIMGGLHRPPA